MTRQIIAAATSILTLWGMKRAGDKKASGWLISLCNQIIWFITIVVFQAWGLLILNVALTFMYARNWVAWRQEEADAAR